MPVVDRLLHIAQRLLSDKYRASEITEYAVHSLSRIHGDNIGEYPTVKVLNRARLYAVDQRAGGRRARRKLDLELFVETLDLLEDQFDLAAFCESKVMLDKIVEQLDPLGLDRVMELLPWMLLNTDGTELTSLFGPKNEIRSLRAFIGECEKRPTLRELLGTEFGECIV